MKAWNKELMTVFNLQQNNVLKTENERVKARNRRLEDEHLKKERTIEQLLDPTKVCWNSHSCIRKEKGHSFLLELKAFGPRFFGNFF